MEWLETTEVYSLTVLEARRVNLRCQQGSFFLKPLFWVSLLVSGGNWPFSASLGLWIASVSIFRWSSLLCPYQIPLELL